MTHHWVPSGKNRLAVDLPSRPNGAVVTQAGHAANSAVPHTLRKQLGRTTSQTRTRASGFVDFGQEQLRAWRHRFAPRLQTHLAKTDSGHSAPETTAATIVAAGRCSGSIKGSRNAILPRRRSCERGTVFGAGALGPSRQDGARNAASADLPGLGI